LDDILTTEQSLDYNVIDTGPQQVHIDADLL
jgi:hypothetical protein